VHSRKEELLDQIEREIDALARESLRPAARGKAGGAGTGQAGTSDAAARVAALWRMIAELDPEIARRITGYDDTGRQRAGD